MPECTQTKPACVLIADNDAGVSAVLTRVLERIGLGVELAADGQVALDRLRDGGVDLLVCDLDMPKLSGEEVLVAMGEIPGAPPAVVISGYLDTVSNQKLLALPMVRFTLRKPFDVFAFGDLIRDMCAGEASVVPASLASRIQSAPQEGMAGA